MCYTIAIYRGRFYEKYNEKNDESDINFGFCYVNYYFRY